MAKKGRHQGLIERIVCHKLTELIQSWDKELEEKRREKRGNMTSDEVQASVSFVERRDALLSRIRSVCKKAGLTRNQTTELIERITSQTLRKIQKTTS